MPELPNIDLYLVPRRAPQCTMILLARGPCITVIRLKMQQASNPTFSISLVDISSEHIVVGKAWSTTCLLFYVRRKPSFMLEAKARPAI